MVVPAGIAVGPVRIMSCPVRLAAPASVSGPIERRERLEDAGGKAVIVYCPSARPLTAYWPAAPVVVTWQRPLLLHTCKNAPTSAFAAVAIFAKTPPEIAPPVGGAPFRTS